MKQVARVTGVLPDGRARVSVLRQSACAGDCGSCHGCDGMEAREVEAICADPLGVAVGERVTIESQTSAVLRGASLVYLIPIIALLIGYFIAAQCFAASEGICILAGFAGLAIGFLPALWLNHVKKEIPDFTIIGRVY